MNKQTVTPTVSELITAIQSGNGAKVAKALYVLGVDITAKNTYRTFSKSIPYSTCANFIRKNGATMPQADILAQFDIEIVAGDIFTATYEQAIDNHASAQAVDIAKQAVADYRESLKPVETESVKPAKATSKVQAFGKPEGLTVGTTFAFEGGHYRVVNQLSNGQYRINLQRGIKSVKLDGQKFTVGTFTLERVKGVSENSFNAKLAKAETVKPAAPIATAEKKTRKAKAVKSEPVKPENELSFEERFSRLEGLMLKALGG